LFLTMPESHNFMTDTYHQVQKREKEAQTHALPSH
jgi:hypothetical protein